MKFNDIVLLCEESKKEVRVGYQVGGAVRFIHHLVDGKLHREDGPALEWFTEDGKKLLVKYCINGELHREDGPAYIKYSSDGIKRSETYFIGGVRHRIDGPAMIYYKSNGDIIEAMYYINGEKYTEEEYDEYFKGLEGREDRQALADIKIDFD